MTVQSPPPPPPPTAYPGAPPPPRKGLSPLAWVGIGCGAVLVLVLIGVIAAGMFVKKKVGEYADNPEMAAAELIVRANPDVELVDSDREAGTMTIRNKKTGEVMTLNLDDIKEGRIEFETDEGTSSIDMSGGEDGGQLTVTDEKGQTSTFTAGGGAPENLPDWVPAYPGGTPQGTYDSTGADGRNGGFVVSTSDPAADVLAFYESELKGAGFAVEKSTFTSNGTSGGSVTGTSEDQKRTLTVGISSDGSGTQAMVSFSEKP